MSTTVTYKGDTLATVSNDTVTLETGGTWLEDDITLTDVTSSATLGTKAITANGTYEATDDNYDGYSEVSVNVPASAVDSGTKTITANGTHDVIGYASASVSVPNTYSASDEGKVVDNGELVSQTSGIYTENGTYDTTLINEVTVNVSGGSTATIVDTTDPGGGTIREITVDDVVHLGPKSITSNGTYDPSDDGLTGYSDVTVDVQPSLQSKTNISPTTSSQTITPDSDYYGLSSVQINAIPSGSAGTPTASKGTVSNHAVSVTPSVTNTTGYITGGTKTGTAVSVSASELVSGNKSIADNGTNIDVTNYATVSVAVPFSTIYSGTSDPSSSTGSNGDVYIKVVS